MSSRTLRSTAETRPAGEVIPRPLAHPITSFAIPNVFAECVFSETDVPVVFGVPEEIEVVHPETEDKYHTCRVAVSIDEEHVGYIPLPKRYRATWLELSYNIVLYTQMWRLWGDEAATAPRRSMKDKFVILRKNSGAVVAQHKLARLLAIEELLTLSLEASAPGEESVRILDEWRTRWCRDWLTSNYKQVVASGAMYLNADPIHPNNRAFFGESILLA